MNSPFASQRRLPVTFQRRLVGAWIFSLLLVFCGGARAELAEKVAERIKKSTVRVLTFAHGQPQCTGSGFIISKNGHVITNHHVTKDGDEFVVLYSEGDKVFYRPAQLVVISDTADLVILKIDPIPSTEVVRVATIELVAGQVVMSVGFPGIIDKGNFLTLEGIEKGYKSGEGRITNPEALGDFVPAVFPGAVAKMDTIGGMRCVLHSAKVTGGNSGGPLVDADGRVCGINTWNIAASDAGADYPVAIHASELVALARSHSIPIDITSSKASSGAGGGSGMQMLLLVVLAAFAVVMFLMVLRKPRMVMVDAVSKLVHSKHQPVGQRAYRATIPPPPHASMNTGGMRLRGRDLEGRSYDIAFSDSDFHLAGGKLVIGRNNDLSQLHLSHDSVSRQHATLSSRGGVVHVEDRNSGNGTKVNGMEIIMGSSSVVLKPGDKLTLGEVDLMFEILN